jgi:hypothetical protein
MFRQFASASSSVQHLVGIMVADLATTVATVTAAAAVIGADIIIIGTDQRL